MDFYDRPNEARLVHDLYRRRLRLETSHPTSIRLRDIGVEVESLQESEAGMSTENPSDAHVKGREKVTIRRRDHTIEAVAENVLTSTRDAFHLLVSIEIRRDGLPYFGKSWTRVFKRILS